MVESQSNEMDQKNKIKREQRDILLIKKVNDTIEEIFKACKNIKIDWAIPDISWKGNDEAEIKFKDSKFTLIANVSSISETIMFLCIIGDKKFKGGTTKEKIADLYMTCIKKSNE